MKFFIKHKWVGVGTLVAACGLLVYFMATAKTSLVPNEDTGSLFISVDAAPGTTLAETNDILTEMQNSIKDIEEIQTYNQVAGFSFSGSGASHAMMMIRLKDWSLRPDKDQSYTGYGTGNSFFVDLQDRSGRGIDALEEVTQGFIAALNERPEVQMAYTSFSSDFPQYQIDVDAAKCIRAGTTTDAVLSVLSGYYGSMYVSNFNRFTKLYRVILQAPPEFRDNMQSLDDVYVRTTDGMAPVSQFVTLTKIYGAEGQQGGPAYRFRLRVLRHDP